MLEVKAVVVVLGEMRSSPRASAASQVLAPVWPEVDIRARDSRREIVVRVEGGGGGMEGSECGCSRGGGKGGSGGVIVYVTLLRESGAAALVAVDVDESSVA